MFFTLFGCWVQGGGGVQTGLVHNLRMQFFILYTSKSKFLKLCLDIVIFENDHMTIANM